MIYRQQETSNEFPMVCAAPRTFFSWPDLFLPNLLDNLLLTGPVKPAGRGRYHNLSPFWTFWPNRPERK